MKPYIFTTETYFELPLEKVFDFFSKAENLNRITPPELQFEILTPLPFEMEVGRLIDYRIKLMGIPFKWKTQITRWEPPYAFTDTQMSGPYSIWEHTHTFECRGNGTVMTDTVKYYAKGSIFAPLLHQLFVDKKVKEIFAYRQIKLNELFGEPIFTEKM